MLELWESIRNLTAKTNTSITPGEKKNEEGRIRQLRSVGKRKLKKRASSFWNHTKGSCGSSIKPWALSTSHFGLHWWFYSHDSLPYIVDREVPHTSGRPTHLSHLHSLLSRPKIPLIIKMDHFRFETLAQDQNWRFSNWQRISHLLPPRDILDLHIIPLSVHSQPEESSTFH